MPPTESQQSKPINPNQRLLSQLKEHIVQIEAMVTYVVICIVVLYLVEQSGLRLPIWLFPSVLLVGLRQVVRVTNPTSAVRNALVWAGTVGGTVGAIVGATCDALAGGLTGGQGTLIGFGAGGAVGGALGNWIEGWGKKNDLLERGDAFDYLYKRRNKNHHVANPTLVNKALDEKVKSFDKNEDGRKWYAVDDLDTFLQTP